MPSTAYLESLVGIPEVIDGGKPLDPSSPSTITPPALQARRSSHLSFPTLGPPDMLYVVKRYTPTLGTPRLYGYYHFVRGVSPSSVAQISAYIADVVSHRGLDTPSWMISSMSYSYAVVSATFLSYNLFNATDVVVHVDLPGGTSAKIVDASGKDIQNQLVDSDVFWAQLVVSERLRHFARVGETPMYPCLRVLPDPPFAALLAAAARCAHTWPLAGSESRAAVLDEHEGEEDGEGEGSDEGSHSDEHTTTRHPIIPSKSRVASIVNDHLLKHCRYEAVVSFFTHPDVLKADALNVVYAARAHRLAKDPARSLAVVDELIRTHPPSDSALLEKAYAHRSLGQMESCLSALDAACSAHVDQADVVFWASVADIYADEGMYAKSFTALNEAEMPAPVLDAFLRNLLKERNADTVPVQGGGNAAALSENGDAVRVLTKKFREERNYISESTDETLVELPAKLMGDIDKLCYSVLVKLLNALTWDRMLAIRGECFVMETDIEEGSDANPKMNGNGNGNGSAKHSSSSNNKSNAEENGEKTSEQTQGKEKEEQHNEEAENIKENGNGSDVDTITNGTTTISLDDDDDDDDNRPRTPPPNTDNRKLRLERNGKKVCKPWLDYLVTNMYNDLRAMAQWTAEEEQQQQAAAAASLAAAATTRKPSDPSSSSSSSSLSTLTRSTSVSAGEIDLEAASTPGSDLAPRTSDAIAKSSIRPSADWLRRGELAVRLGKPDDARTAFLVAVAREKDVAATATLRLMTLAAANADIKATLRYTDALWNFIDTRTHRRLPLPHTEQAGTSQHTVTSQHAPPTVDVAAAVFKLVSAKGLCAVRDVLTLPAIDLNTKRMEGLLLDAVALRVDGFSR